METRIEKALWYLLAGTRGGTNRARLVRAIDERPRNANQLSEALDLGYNTIRYHLGKLEDHDVETGGEDYGELYFSPTASSATARSSRPSPTA